MLARKIDLSNPDTWEFSGFSQNGEDGILDVLRDQLSQSDRYFIEIGAANGIENNTAWLLVAEKYNGMMVEGNARLVARARRMLASFSIGAEFANIFVTQENVREIWDQALYKNPDVLSLDIDGNDYYIAAALLGFGLRPKIVVVEYNSAFGPTNSVTIKYKENFNFTSAHPTNLYYGVSIAAWQRLFRSHGYQFVTVDRNGVNAFFVDPQYYRRDFLDGVRGLAFTENRYQLAKFRVQNSEQLALIADQELVRV